MSRAPRYILNGLNPLAYMGVNPYTPPDLVLQNRPPTVNDFNNRQIGDLWLDLTRTIPTAADIYMLVSVALNIATWVRFGAVGIQTLTGSSGGGPVPGDALGNINLNAGTGISIVGDPGTNSLAFNLTGGASVSTITGTTGGAVGPDGTGTINLLGNQAYVTVAGDPATHTLSISVVDTLTGSTGGGPVPPDGAGNTNLHAGQGITITGNAATHTQTFVNTGVITVTTDDAVTTMPNAAGNIFITGLPGDHIVTAGIPLTNTVVISTTFEEFVQTLTGNNTGVQVTASNAAATPPNNINVVGTGPITVTGNDATHTLTISTTATGTVDTLTGDTGGAVGPDGAANINIRGGTNVAVAGNPGTHTLTINATVPAAAETLTGNAGGAVSPDGGGNINIVGAVGSGITVTGTPLTNTLTLTSNAVQTLTGTGGGGAIGVDGAHNINLAGAGGVTVTGAGNTLTITGGGGGGAGTWQLLATRDITGMVNVIFDDTVITADYNYYKLYAYNVVPLFDNTQMAFYFSTDNGATYTGMSCGLGYTNYISSTGYAVIAMGGSGSDVFINDMLTAASFPGKPAISNAEVSLNNITSGLYLPAATGISTSPFFSPAGNSQYGTSFFAYQAGAAAVYNNLKINATVDTVPLFASGTLVLYGLHV